MNLPHNDEHYVALGKYTHLRKALTTARTALQAKVALFGDHLKEAVSSERDDTINALDVERWRAAFEQIGRDSEQIAELAREADAQARLCGEQPVKLYCRPAPSR